MSASYVLCVCVAATEPVAKTPHFCLPPAHTCLTNGIGSRIAHVRERVICGCAPAHAEFLRGWGKRVVGATVELSRVAWQQLLSNVLEATAVGVVETGPRLQGMKTDLHGSCGTFCS